MIGLRPTIELDAVSGSYPECLYEQTKGTAAQFGYRTASSGDNVKCIQSVRQGNPAKRNN